MKYFLDTEFLEGSQKTFFGKTKPTIDLISIGIVAEDRREYYAISKDFNLKEAWNRYDLEQQSGDMRNMFPEGRKVYWLRENVLKPIYYELIGKDIDFHDYDMFFTYKALKNLIKKKGKTNKQIAEDVKLFCSYKTKIQGGENTLYMNKDEDIEFYAYYADYDWVVFCWLFGKMIDLPKGFPMYCKDLKQVMDDTVKIYCSSEIKSTSFDSAIERFKKHSSYPKQDSSKSHNAIEDARWNKQLFEFLNKL